MTIRELMDYVAEKIPAVQFGEDNDGQLILYTGMYAPLGISSDSELRELPENT